MRRFPILNFRLAIIGTAILFVSSAAGAVNVNGNGASLNLLTTDLSSGTVQSNGAGGRLVAAGTPGKGILSTNAAGAKVIIEPINAIAGNTAPVADFAANPTSGSAPLQVQFTSLAAGGLYEILTWSWDFGDGSPTSSEQNPKHTYDNPGTYSVSLTITTAGGGSFSQTKESYIAVTQGLPATSHVGLLLAATAFAMLGVAMARKALNNR